MILRLPSRTGKQSLALFYSYGRMWRGERFMWQAYTMADGGWFLMMRFGLFGVNLYLGEYRRTP